MFASSIFYYPNYSHNHLTVAAASMALAFYALRALEESDFRSAWLGLVCTLITFLTRPILNGYAVAGLFVLALPRLLPRENRAKNLGILGATVLLVGVFFGAIFGGFIRHALFPRQGAIYGAGNYPNLHFLFPRIEWEQGKVVALLKAFRTSLDTMIFYLHFFMAPAALLTLVVLRQHRTLARRALICLALALAGSLDILHYGDVNPSLDPLMLGRGHYFAMLSLLSFFLILYRPATEAKEWLTRVGAGAVLVVFTFWGYLSYGTGIYTWHTSRINPYKFPVLAGIAVPPIEEPNQAAVDFINHQSRLGDRVLIAFYAGGMGRLLNIPNLFENDTCLVDSPLQAVMRPGDSPYNLERAQTMEELVKERMRQYSPRFLLGNAKSPFLETCSSPGWHVRDFKPNGATRVCWRD
jgi:hypothetical protein